MRNRELLHFLQPPAPLASGVLDGTARLFNKSLRNRLVVFSVLALLASLARGQNIFNCSSGFATSGSCGVAFFYPLNQNFYVVGATNSYTSVLSGSQIELALPNAVHTALNVNYSAAKVNVQEFIAHYSYVPNGWNISFVLQNNTSTQGGIYGMNAAFSSGAGCEDSFFQAYPNGGVAWDPPNNIFAVQLDQYGPLTDGNAPSQGGAGYPGTFTYSGTQIYGQQQDPCNPRFGSEKYYYFTKKVSTSPVPLNSPANGQNTTTGHTYSVTITYTGSNVTEQLYDVTAGGSCPAALAPRATRETPPAAVAE